MSQIFDAEMQNELNAVIAKNLPQQTVGILKERLELIDHLEKEVENLKAINEKQRETIAEKVSEINRLEIKLKDYTQFDIRNSQLDNREKELDNKQIRLETDELKYQLNAEKEKTNFTKDVALGLVRNTEYRKSLTSNYYDSESIAPNEKNNWQHQSNSKNGNNSSTEINQGL